MLKQENNKNQNQNTKKFASPKAPAKKSKTRSSKLAQELNELNKADMNSENKPSTLASTHAQVVSWQKQSVGKDKASTYLLKISHSLGFIRRKQFGKLSVRCLFGIGINL